MYVAVKAVFWVLLGIYLCLRCLMVNRCIHTREPVDPHPPPGREPYEVVELEG
jgi:hypothetical protein